MKCVLAVVVFTICSTLVVAIPPQYRPTPGTITLDDGQVMQLPTLIMPGPPRPVICPPKPSDVGVAGTFDIKRPLVADTFDIKIPRPRPAICPPRPSLLPSFPIINRPAIGDIQPFNAVIDADVNVPQIAICPPKPE